jgi:hypothetical protein
MLDTNPLVLKECSECHDAYSARLLPTSSWRKIMGDLGNHFGEDASLDNATRKQIESHLVRNGYKGDGGSLRISQSNWFRHEHRDDIKKHKARSWSNCSACHR